MLQRYPVYAVVASSDGERSKAWFRENLGMTPDQEAPGGLWFECAGGTWLLVTASSLAGTAQNTVATFRVEGIVPVMDELRGRGVVFEDYDMPGLKTENGLFEMEGYQATWFKDPDGNTFELSEPPS